MAMRRLKKEGDPLPESPTGSPTATVGGSGTAALGVASPLGGAGSSSRRSMLFRKLFVLGLIVFVLFAASSLWLTSLLQSSGEEPWEPTPDIPSEEGTWPERWRRRTDRPVAHHKPTTAANAGGRTPGAAHFPERDEGSGSESDESSSSSSSSSNGSGSGNEGSSDDAQQQGQHPTTRARAATTTTAAKPTRRSSTSAPHTRPKGSSRFEKAFLSIIVPIRSTQVPLESLLHGMVSALRRYGVSPRGTGLVPWGLRMELILSVPLSARKPFFAEEELYHVADEFQQLCGPLTAAVEKEFRTEMKRKRNGRDSEKKRSTNIAQEDAAIAVRKVCRIITVSPNPDENLYAVLVNHAAKKANILSTHIVVIDPSHRPIYLEDNFVPWLDKMMWPFVNGTHQQKVKVTGATVTAVLGATPGADRLKPDEFSMLDEFVVSQGFDVVLSDGTFNRANAELRAVRRYNGYPKTSSVVHAQKEKPVFGVSPFACVIDLKHFYQLQGFNVSLVSSTDLLLHERLSDLSFVRSLGRLFLRRQLMLGLITNVTISEVSSGSEAFREVIRLVAGGMSDLQQDFDSLLGYSHFDAGKDVEPALQKEEYDYVHSLDAQYLQHKIKKEVVLRRGYKRLLEAHEEAMRYNRMPPEEELGIEFALRTYRTLVPETSKPHPIAEALSSPSARESSGGLSKIYNRSTAMLRGGQQEYHSTPRVKVPPFFISTDAIVQLFLSRDAIPKGLLELSSWRDFFYGGSFPLSPQVFQTQFNAALQVLPQYSGAPHLRVLWEMQCCVCCGFASEVVHFLQPLQERREVHITFEAQGCFCPGYPRAVETQLNRLPLQSSGFSIRRHRPYSFEDEVGDERRDIKAAPQLPMGADIIVRVIHRPPLYYKQGFNYNSDLPADYVIGRSMCEFNKIHAVWKGMVMNSTDELWVPGQFVKETYLSTGIPEEHIFVVPEAVDVHFWDPAIDFPPSPLSSFPVVGYNNTYKLNPRQNRTIRLFCNRQGQRFRQERAERQQRQTPAGAHGRPAANKPFIFLSVFKWEPRKGWDVLFRAYHQMFQDRNEEDVILYISTLVYVVQSVQVADPFNITHLTLELLKWGHTELGIESLDDLPPFCLFVDDLMEEELVRLYSVANAFVLPTRGEGWGLPLIQAMAMGLPTIGTGWGGQTEFMNSTNSLLIDYELVNVSSPHRMYDEVPGAMWAQPDLQSTAKLMNQVFTDRRQNTEIGHRARQSVVQHFSEAAVADLIDRRLDVIREKVIERRKKGIPRWIPGSQRY